MKEELTKKATSKRATKRDLGAELLESVHTLQDWEQGRREPSGAAKTLIAIAERSPEVLREVVV